jgi:hypothetical protein
VKYKKVEANSTISVASRSEQSGGHLQSLA